MKRTYIIALGILCGMFTLQMHGQSFPGNNNLSRSEFIKGGVYLYSLQTESGRLWKKMVNLK